MYVSEPEYVYSASGDQKKLLDPLGPDLPVSCEPCDVGAGNQI